MASSGVFSRPMPANFVALMLAIFLSPVSNASVQAFYEIPTQDPLLQAAAIFDVSSDADGYNSNGRATNELRLELPAALTGQPHAFTLFRQPQGNFSGTANNIALPSQPSNVTAALAPSATASCSASISDAERGDWVVCDMQFSNLVFDHNLRDQALIRDFRPQDFLSRQRISRQFEGQPIGRLHYRVR